MPTIDAERTLGEIVTAHPSLARDFERLGLDYCCGGAQTIGQACAERGLDQAAVLADLEAATVVEPAAPWSTMGVDELVDHLEATHHQYLWSELPRLSALTDKVVAAHGSAHPELVDIRDCSADIRADLEPHMMKEERVLFPMIRELAHARELPSFHCGSVRNPIGMMMFEHERVGELLARLRALTSGYRVPADACASYTALFVGFDQLEADTHLHVHKENNVLFPAVEQIEARLMA